MYIDPQEFYLNAWRWKCGFKPLPTYKKQNLNIKELYETQWFPEFEQKMRNRMVMGCLRYGPIKKGPEANFPYLEYALKKLKVYKETGNWEGLVDAANLMMLEALNSKHPNLHFAALENIEHCEEV